MLWPSAASRCVWQQRSRRLEQPREGGSCWQRTAHAAASQLLLSQGPLQTRLKKEFQQHRELLTSSFTAPPILLCPSCKGGDWEHGRLCHVHCLENSFGLLQREELGKRELPELGCGPGECPDKGSRPRDWSCGSAANHFKPAHWMSKAGPWSCAQR